VNKIVHEKNYELWSGLSEIYHDSRPIPPEIVIKIILSWLQKEPDTVVDIGCGTGLSTIIWNDIAKNIIGIEPNDDMRTTAKKNVESDCIIFMNGVSNKTNLPSDYADIITVSQAFHWMDIDSTLLEFYRVIKPGGVLAIYDFILPPILGWEVEEAFAELRAKCHKIIYSQETPPVHNDKDTYNDRIKLFGKFRYSREVKCHNVKIYTLHKLMDFLYDTSMSNIAIKIDDTIKYDIDELNGLVNAKCVDEVEVIFAYNIVIAVK